MYSLGILIGLFDWAHPSKRYRSQVLSLRERDFTHTAVFSGMSTVRIVMREHLPFIIPYMLADVISGFLFSIGFEVTLSYLGLADLDSPTVGTMIYWATYYQSVFAGRAWVIIVPCVTVILMVLGFYLMSVGLGEYLDPRKRLARITTVIAATADTMTPEYLTRLTEDLAPIPDNDPRKDKDDVWAP